MTRNTIFTAVLMAGSMVAAFAAPGLPDDTSLACADVQIQRLLQSDQASAQHSTDELVLIAADSQAAPGHDSTRACDFELIEPYRQLHQGSIRLELVCDKQAST